MRMTLISNTTDAAAAYSDNLVFPFERTRILSGSTVIWDCSSQARTLQLLTYNATARISEAGMEKLSVGDVVASARVTAFQTGGGVEYMFPLYPWNTFLRGSHLVEVATSNDLILEFWTCTNQQYIYSPAPDNSASYTINNIEILAEYLTSPTIGQLVRSQGLALSLFDYTPRYQVLSQATENVRLPSANTSLNGWFTAMRAQTVESSYAGVNKASAFNTNSLLSYQVLINSTYELFIFVCCTNFRANSEREKILGSTTMSRSRLLFRYTEKSSFFSKRICLDAKN
jgi:hypothetical protein